MASFNRVTLIGNLGADPKVVNLEGNSKLVAFSLATSSTYTDKSGVRRESTEWHDIVTFGKVGENCAKFLKKGSSVLVEGPLHYKDREIGGVTVKQASINASKVLFLDKKGQAAEASEGEEAPF
jgi:single-strand DNA-binding protein